MTTQCLTAEDRVSIISLKELYDEDKSMSNKETSGKL